jgi:hypothetical protein
VACIEFMLIEQISLFPFSDEEVWLAAIKWKCAATVSTA